MDHSVGGEWEQLGKGYLWELESCYHNEPPVNGNGNNWNPKETDFTSGRTQGR